MDHHITPIMMSVAADIYFEISELVALKKVELARDKGPGAWPESQTNQIRVTMHMAPGRVYITVARYDRAGVALSDEAVIEIGQEGKDWCGTGLYGEMVGVYRRSLEKFRAGAR